MSDLCCALQYRGLIPVIQKSCDSACGFDFPRVEVLDGLEFLSAAIFLSRRVSIRTKLRLLFDLLDLDGFFSDARWTLCATLTLDSNLVNDLSPNRQRLLNENYSEANMIGFLLFRASLQSYAISKTDRS